jgi:putative redox protein
MSSVNAAMTGKGPFQVLVRAGPHSLILDEPLEVGGEATGPNPFDLLCAALASCTLMTLHLYAARKGWTLDGLRVAVTHEKGSAGQRDRFDRVLELGDVSAEQRERLLAIAQRCPVDLLLGRGADVTVTLAENSLPTAAADCLHAQEMDELCNEAG